MDIESLTNEVVRRLLDKVELQKKEESADIKKAFLQSDRDTVSIEGYTPVLLDHAMDTNKVFKYDFLVVGTLSLDEMASMANGMSTNTKTDAIRKFLLTGKKVYIVENGLAHKAFKETANTSYYKMFEDYEEKMIQFGVEITTPMALEKIYSYKNTSLLQVRDVGANEKKSAQLRINYSTDRKLITLEMALKMRNESVITLKSDTIITPSARDVLKENNIGIQYL